jgi:hydroxymethylpyrimidine pyrophosphatase-like HAD family hydrolase
MLKVAGYGVAMGNAGQLVKQEADFVTKDVDDDGILFGLKELELI